MDAGAAEFDEFVADGFEGRELKFLSTVVAAIFRSRSAGLETISADDVSARCVFDEEMIANFVEVISVEAGR